MKKEDMTIDRRKFLTQSAAVTTYASLTPSALAQTRSIGANDRVRMGFIGLGNRGSQLLQHFMTHKDVEIVALCDVYEPYALRDPTQVDERWRATGKTPKMGEAMPSDVKYFKDFREMLAMKDLDAVCIASPDHWHAIQTIQAIEAGKDVYVEKPLTNTIKEGRAMVEAHNKSNQIVAVGLNRRGSSVYQKLAADIQGGKIGKVVTAQAYRISNMFPNGIGKLQAETPPPNFDWDMWLGPRAHRPYQYNIAPYFFRWWSEYSSQMGNWGVHYMDVIRWLSGETAPIAITANSMSGLINDDRNIPDTMEVTFEFKSGMMIQFHIYEACHASGIKGGEIELNGTLGSLVADQNGYNITPARAGQFQKWKNPLKAETYELESAAAYGDLAIKEDSTANLIRNFLDCVKSRQAPLCSLEDGHRSTSFAHLANIALATGTRIEWDAKREVITNNDAANNLLHYEYRKPWKL